MVKKIFILFFILFGCSSNILKDKLEGIWKYNNDNNEYAEIWFDKFHVLMLDETSYNIEIFNYAFIDDSLILKSLKGDESMYRLKYIFKSDSNLILENRYVKFKLKKIKDGIEIDTSLIDNKHLYNEFRERKMIEYQK